MVKTELQELDLLLEPLCEGTLEDGAPALQRLIELLDKSESCRRRYLDTVELHAVLWMMGGVGPMMPEIPPAPEPAASRRVRRTPEPSHAPPVVNLFSGAGHPSFGHFTHGVLFWCLIGVVLIGIGVVLGSLKAPSPAVDLVARQEAEIVGRITGMADCKWAKDSPLPDNDNGNYVRMGRLFKLDAGFMEITYDCGATVILQGPAAYAIDSKTGGYLSLGKLTTRLQKKANSPLSTLHSPRFTVRTPVAAITDFGTEFGVDVSESGCVATEVFEGSVQVQSSLAQPQSSPQVQTVDQVTTLRANESVRVQAGSKGVETVRIPVQPNAFARKMPPRTLSLVRTTGNDLQEGDPDPHWQIVARSDAPHFKPCPAIVARVPRAYWLANGPARSQWISLHGSPGAARDVVYTFRTTFDLTGFRPETATLQGKFIVDDYVEAVRLNGKNLPVPPHGTNGLPRNAEGKLYRVFNDLAISSEFVAGQNTLELDIGNGVVNKKLGGASPMGFRAELEIDAQQVSP